MAAGLDPYAEAESLEELWAWNQALTEITGDGGYNRVGFIPWVGNWGVPAWMWTFGGTLLDETGLRPTTRLTPRTSKPSSGCASRQKATEPRPVQGGWTGFANGTVAMVAESTTTAGRLIEQGIDFVTGRVPNPPGGTNGTWGGGQALGVPINARNKEEALKLLRYFGLEEVQALASGSLPRRSRRTGTHCRRSCLTCRRPTSRC